MSSAPVIHAIRAWVALDEARAAFNRDLKRRFDLSGLELAILRIVAERPSQRLIDLRRSLSLHPATLGQILDRLVTKGLCARRRDPADGRAWCVSMRPRGRRLIARAPLVGPVRLRSVAVSPAKLRRVARAFEEATELFGLGPWLAAPGIADEAPRPSRPAGDAPAQHRRNACRPVPK